MQINKRARFEEEGGFGDMSLEPSLFGPGRSNSGQASPRPGDDDEVEDLTKSDKEELDEEEKLSERAKLRKRLGFPEIDPDALPSSMVTKYMNLACKHLIV